MELHVVGKPLPRVDSLPKVTGQAVYAGDLKVKGMLYARVLRSPVPHAIVKNLDTAKAKTAAGVVAVLTAKDIPGPNRHGIFLKDEPLLVEDRVRKVGDPLALVIAESEEAAAQALPLIVVEYEPLPLVGSINDVLTKDLPALHPEGNVRTVARIVRGDVQAAVGEAAAVVTRRYVTQMVEHAYLELEAAVAVFDGGVLTIYSCNQLPHFIRDEVAANLNLKQSQVRVVQTVTGGGFGGKQDSSLSCLVALGALKTRRPVFMSYEREESFFTSTKRHPFQIEYTSAADREGRLLGVRVRIYGDTGAYTAFGHPTLQRAAIHATGPYAVPSVDIEASVVYTNNPSAGAMRGFGVPQITFAHETQMDLLAEALGLDRLEIRRRNFMQDGVVTATGQKLDASVGISQTFSAAVERAREIGLNPTGRGVGIACFWYGIGKTSMPNTSGAVVDMASDGSAIVLSGAADIGQGSNTALAQIAAEELGISLDDITIITADTGVCPNADASSASRQTFISGNAVRNAAKAVKQILLEEAPELAGASEAAEYNLGGGYLWRNGQRLDITVKQLAMACKKKGKALLSAGQYDPHVSMLDAQGQGRPYATYAFGTQIAEVQVDADTGRVEVSRVVAAHDVGQAINPLSVEGQIEGGIAMGLGYALSEEVVTRDGRILNPNFTDYLLPTFLDMPEMSSLIVEDNEPAGPFGAKGVGEPSLVPTAAAVANAVASALGRRFYQLPLTPERIVLSQQLE